MKTPPIPKLEIDNTIKKVIVPEYPLIANLFEKIRYVQPNPLPPPIAYLMACGLRGLEFVRIPINEKEDNLYLRDSIIKLLSICGMNKTYVEQLVDSYNDDIIIDKQLSRSLLKNLYELSIDYCDKKNIEFLRI